MTVKIIKFCVLFLMLSILFACSSIKERPSSMTVEKEVKIADNYAPSETRYVQIADNQNPNPIAPVIDFVRDHALEIAIGAVVITGVYYFSIRDKKDGSSSGGSTTEGSTGTSGSGALKGN